MKKVYCDNCKFFDDLFYCSHPTNQEIINDWQKSYISYKIRPRDMNKNNDCKLYKKKWWKFWI